jgi:hypothetical protein
LETEKPLRTRNVKGSLKMDEDTVTAIYGTGGGTYLKADDAHEADMELVIAAWDKREMDQTDFETGEKYKKWKVILSFAGEEKKLVLNKTNADAIKAAYGDGLNQWVGKTIVIFEGDWKGKPCLRVRTPKAVKKVASAQKYDERNPPANLNSPRRDPDDAIPF